MAEKTDEKTKEKIKEPEEKQAKGRKKAAEPEPQAESVSATARYVRISPRKLRLVADLVRGKPVDEARTVLAFTPKDAARVVDKLIASAVANAENNYDMNADDLLVSSIFVNEGPTMKRWRARAMGRASRIKKRTSHLSVELTTGGER